MEQRAIGWKESLAHITAWFVSTALILADLIFIRGAVQEFMVWLSTKQAEAERAAGNLVGHGDYGWTIEAVDRGALLILGCAGVALAIVCEYYFRAGLKQGVFLRRVGKVFAIEVGVVLVALLLQYIF